MSITAGQIATKLLYGSSRYPRGFEFYVSEVAQTLHMTEAFVCQPQVSETQISEILQLSDVGNAGYRFRSRLCREGGAK